VITVLVLSLVGASAWWAMVGAAGAVSSSVLVLSLVEASLGLAGGGCCWCSGVLLGGGGGGGGDFGAAKTFSWGHRLSPERTLGFNEPGGEFR
jgi:hypothetical protein